MKAKLEITGTIEVLTGLHIGGNEGFSAIGAIDSPVIKDVYSGNPMIPGSSLKGKLRTLLAEVHNDREKNPGNRIELDAPEIKRLFGASNDDNSKEEKKHNSRLIFTDMIAENVEELRKYGIDYPAEVKFENSINRLSGVANPRQIERVVRGTRFPLWIIYNVESEEEAIEDINLLKEGFQLLQYDYLGGHGSRGYGRVRISDLQAEVCVGELSEGILDGCNRILEEE
nr:type III-A CRISPR-associated RAMP protein Csm3 [Massilistercora timonensis]